MGRASATLAGVGNLADRRVATRITVIAAVTLLLATLAVVASQRASAAPTVQVRTLHFATVVGPAGHRESCDVIGDVYTPSTASAANRMPAILTSNGFGGSKNDQASFARRYAANGYVVLSYSGLGFGGSACKITLDDPDYDGLAARQLVSFLGGAAGIAFTDAGHTHPVAGLNVVQLDGPDDPRVGMTGGSYGGGNQFAAAAVDPRIDTIVPQITWNDLSYSLTPNNTDLATGVSSANAGVAKLNWALGFSAIGALDGLIGAKGDPGRLLPCPNFADWICPSLVTAGVTGYADPTTVAHLRHASVASFIDSIKIPVLLDQGQVDSLFNLNEAVATYQGLAARGVTVRMMWRESGHSGGTASKAGDAYESLRIQAWFDHFLKGTNEPIGPAFAYYQDWTGTFTEASAYPVGSPMPLYLSGSGQLVSQPSDVQPGSTGLLAGGLGLPTTLGPTDAFPLPLPQSSVPGTTTSWESAPLGQALDVVGSPTVDVQLFAPVAQLTQAAGAVGDLVVFFKLYDVGPDGKASLIHGLVAPVRIADVDKPVHVTLPGIAHRFGAGHRIELAVAGGDINYRAGNFPTTVTIAAGPTQVLTLPTVPAE